MRGVITACRAIALAIILLWPSLLHGQTPASGYEIRIVTGDSGPVTEQILQSLRRRFPALQVVADPVQLPSRKGRMLYVAIGPSALKAALGADIEGPIVSLFCSSQAYMELTSQIKPERRRTVTAIYAEASPVHQMQLISRLLGREVVVTTMLTENTAYLEPVLNDAARKAQVTLQIEKIKPDENVTRTLTRVAPSSPLLVVPDSSLFTPDNLRTILESTYRRNQVVVGFSTSLVKAGTTATAYSTIDDILAQLEQVVAAISSGAIPPAAFPRYWRVAVNESVARSLNLVVTDEVRALGERPPGKQ